MRMHTGDDEIETLWLDLTPGEAAELRDALNEWDGKPHTEAEWHAHVVGGDGTTITLTVGNMSGQR